MEMDAKPGDLGFYCPMTTPFGYYGPSWRADGTVGPGLNFSLWSYGRGRKEPPLAQLSHLLAVGHPKARFGGFGHEGTGVKVRNWKPFAGLHAQRLVLALRRQVGPVYDSYFAYFYSWKEKRWRFFAAGNKYRAGRKKPSFRLGSFVEVPGPPWVQRSGPYLRRMRYRGWVQDEKGDLHPLDRMHNGDRWRKREWTHSFRGLNKDGWFFLQTGGWGFHKTLKKRWVELQGAAEAERPEYLDPERFSVLAGLPSEVRALSGRQLESRIHGRYLLRHPGKKAKLKLFWGTREGLTLADRWEKSFALEGVGEGEHSFVIEDAPRDRWIYVRFLLENELGRFWSPQSLKIAPAKKGR
jgi:hypothetical protein